MKLVIDISDAIKEMADEDDKRLIHMMWMLILIDAIKNGVVLPKGHVRLIDADTLVDGYEDNYEFCEALNATPTIIEADKEGAE